MRRTSERWRVKRPSWMGWRPECAACFKPSTCKSRSTTPASDPCPSPAPPRPTPHELLPVYGIVPNLARPPINRCEPLLCCLDSDLGRVGSLGGTSRLPQLGRGEAVAPESRLLRSGPLPPEVRHQLSARPPAAVTRNRKKTSNRGGGAGDGGGARRNRNRPDAGTGTESGLPGPEEGWRRRPRSVSGTGR